MGSLLQFLFVLVFYQSLLDPPSVLAQIDGSFWWMNSDLIKKAEQYREEKDVKAVVVNNETEIDSIRLQGNTYTDASDNSPDCICVQSDRCKSTVSQKQGRDGLCGPGNTCCRHKHIIQQHLGNVPLPPPSKLPALPLTTASPTNQQSEHPAPDLELLLEISSLLQEFNTHDNQFEPEAELILPVILPSSTPSTTTTVQPSVTTAGIKPIPSPSKSKKCGQRRAPLASRIHFQDDDNETFEDRLSGVTSFGEFPWTVYIEERITNGSFLYKCGGAVITSNAIVTAGHCVANARNTPENFQVIAGDWDRRHTKEKLPNQRRTVYRIILHPDYYSGALYNDIAVLILSNPLNDSLSNVGSVCVPLNEDALHSSQCILSGWGATPNNPEQEEPIQRFISMPMVASEVCETTIQVNSSLGRRFRMHDSFVCAGGQPGVDSCKGSGGSPLVCEKNGAYVLVGLMSWGMGCGEGIPGVFVSVSYQARWIKEVIDSLEDNVVYFV